jgi:Cytochrome P450
MTLTLNGQTPISQCNYFVHMDPTIFPNPEEFDPDRWLRAEEQGLRIDRYFVSFGKGSRMCVGIKFVFLKFLCHVSNMGGASLTVVNASLAYAELYLTLATILTRFELENFETTVEDVKIHRDYFVGVPKLNSMGVRAKVVARVNT